YYSKSAAVGPVSVREPYHNEEFSFLQSVAKARLKIPITGAYTLAIWSYDEHHTLKQGRLAAGYVRKDEIAARTELTLELPRNLRDDPVVWLGVRDIHTDLVESPELVRDRLLYAVEVFGDPARIHVCPDCGLRTRSWDVAYEKLRALVEGCRLAEEALTRAQVTS